MQPRPGADERKLFLGGFFNARAGDFRFFPFLFQHQSSRPYASEDVAKLLKQYGELLSVEVPLPRSGLGFAFVEYKNHRDAQTALTALRDLRYNGNAISVKWVGESAGREGSRGNSGTSPPVATRKRERSSDSGSGSGIRRVSGGFQAGLWKEKDSVLIERSDDDDGIDF